jgi:hypothetical protein
MGGADDAISADVAAFEAALTAAGAEHEVVTYDGAPHSFFDPSRRTSATPRRTRLRHRVRLGHRFGRRLGLRHRLRRHRSGRSGGPPQRLALGQPVLRTALDSIPMEKLGAVVTAGGPPAPGAALAPSGRPATAY